MTSGMEPSKKMQVAVRPDPENRSRCWALIIEPDGLSTVFKHIAHTVRIIDTPSGEAPEAVREAWVGLEFPSFEPQETNTSGRAPTGVLSGKSSGDYGYTVPAIIAFHLLREKDYAAYQWWRTNTPDLFGPTSGLCFNFSSCEVIASGAGISDAVALLFGTIAVPRGALTKFGNWLLRFLGMRQK